ncbi:MAG TPA: hypothetical protein VKP30_26070, partial [Polyangiaceae bacterium]|nr:hypothetical protein [Polyangiaceae bacterium]
PCFANRITPPPPPFGQISGDTLSHPAFTAGDTHLRPLPDPGANSGQPPQPSASKRETEQPLQLKHQALANLVAQDGANWRRKSNR